MNDSNSAGSAPGGAVSTVEFACQTCGRKLRVSTAHVGRPAKCPQCGGVQVVPSPDGANAQGGVSSGVTSGPGANAGFPASLSVGSPSGSPSIQPQPLSSTSVSSPQAVPAQPTPQPQSSYPQSTYPQSTYPQVAAQPFQPQPFQPQPFAPNGQSAYPGSGPSPFTPPPFSPAPFSPAPSSPAPFTPAPFVPAPQAPVGGSTAPGFGFSNSASSAPALGVSRAVEAPGVHSLADPGRRTPTKELFDRIMGQIGRVYVGQDELVVGTLVALFSNGHVLIESVPGLGKTLFVRTLGRVLGMQFGRIQFTADLMPSDITGAPIFDMKTQEFRFRPGPVFTQLLLADEINRAPAKTHAALLEIMQEFRVTVDGKSHTLEKPFLVMATQNPVESEGTYNLPEAQLDRFMFKLIANYPALDEEKRILQMHSQQVDINRRLEDDLEVVTSPAEILKITRENSDVVVDDRLVDYVAKIVRATRSWPQFHLGASPRAGIAILQAARTLAAFNGRDYAVPDDVVQISIAALRHRVILTAEAEVEGRKPDELLQELIRSVEVPRL